MNNFLQPIETMINRGIETKLMYVAALEGIEQYLMQELESIGYDYDKIPTVNLYHTPTDVRLNMAQSTLSEFESDHRVGIGCFVQYARSVMYDFLKSIYLGYLHDFYLDDHGWFVVKIHCDLDQSFSDNKVSAKNTFENQLARLKSFGFICEKHKTFGHFNFTDTDINRALLKQTLQSRGATRVSICAEEGYVESISFNIHPWKLGNFVCHDSVTCQFEKTGNLNPDEFAKIKKSISDIYSSLSAAVAQEDMVHTCGFVAESAFADICEIVDYDGEIRKHVKERFAKEKAANIGIRQIEQTIGSRFPAEKTQNVMRSLVNDLTYFCVFNCHLMARNISIDQWGRLHANMKWIVDDSILHYLHIDGFNNPLPSVEMFTEIFDIVKGEQRDEAYLIDNEKNRDVLIKFLSDIQGLEVVSITTAAKHIGVDKYYVIDQIEISTQNIASILQYY